MLDRVFTFSDDEIVDIISKKFVPVSTDIWFYEHTKDPAGDFYRKVVTQREGMQEALDKRSTTQGFYIFDPEGKLYFGWNARGGDILKKNLRDALAKYKSPAAPPDDRDDPRKGRHPPEGAAVVDVFAKITEASYPMGGASAHMLAFRNSTGRDHLWISKSEIGSLSRGKLPRALMERITRYHLNDFTRGEPPIWTEADIVKSEMRLEPEGNIYKLTGEVELSADRGSRGYKASLFGYVDASREKLERFDIVARGSFHGFGQFTKPSPPVGAFTLAVAFHVAPPGEASEAPPLGVASGGGYMKE